MKRDTNIAEILHPQNRGEDILRFLVQHQDLPNWRPSGRRNLESRCALSGSQDGGN